MDYSFQKNEILKNIDLRLYNSAVSLKYILPDDYHDRAIDKQAISIEEDVYIVHKMIRLTKETGIKYAYTIIKQGERLFFATTVVLLDTKRGTYYYHDYTEEADKSFFEAFDRTTPTYNTVSDQWGKVRTVMIPQTSPGGIKYLACADYDIGYVKGLLQKNLLRSITTVFLFLFLSVLIILIYSKFRKRSEEELKESEEKYRTLFERESDAIFIYDPDTTNILDANAATSKMYGYSHDELIGMSCLKLSAEVKKSASAIEKVHKDGSLKVQYRFHCKKDGTVFPIDISVYAITLKGGKVMYAVSTDVTKRKRAEEALRASEKKYRHLFNNAPAGICEIDFEKVKFINVNEVMCKYSGYSEEEFLTMNPLDLLTEDSKNLFIERLEKLSTEKNMTRNLEYNIIKKNGQNICVILNSDFIYEKGKLIGARVVVHDITELKKQKKKK